VVEHAARIIVMSETRHTEWWLSLIKDKVEDIRKEHAEEDGGPIGPMDYIVTWPSNSESESASTN